MQIDALDHLVLTVKDINETIQFYESVMGMQRIEFSQGRTALSFGSQKINLHELGNEFEPKAINVKTGSADLCFISSVAVSDVITHLHQCGVEVIDGPVKRTGAIGEITSVYFRDPDGNLIEVSNYL